MKKRYFVGLVFASLLLAGCNPNSTNTSPTHEHNPSSTWEKDEQYHWHTCSDCEELLNKEAHVFVDEVTSPTYETGGYTTHTCSVCGYYYTDSQTDPLVHNYAESWSHDETKHWHACIDEGYESLKTDEANHTFVDKVTAPTYESDGYTTHTCSVCEYSYRDSETPKLEAIELGVSVVSYNEENGLLTWTAVEHADKYNVYDNGEIVVQETDALSMELIKTVGNHSITVKAISKSIEYKDGALSNAYVYETKAIMLEGISYNEGVISINNVNGYVTLFNGNSEATPLGFNASSTNVTTSDKYTIGVSAGYDKDNKILYVGETIYKSTLVVIDAAQELILEDGSAETDADLADKYVATKYDNGWVTTTASIKLDSSNEGYSDGKCVKMNFWNHGTWFKFTSSISVKDGYEGVSFKLKGGSEGCSFSLVFTDSDGNYATYKLQNISTGWTSYNVRFDESTGWNVNGTGATIAQAAASKGLSVKQLVSTFVSYDLRVYHASDSNGTSNAVYLDDLKLVPLMSETSVETIVVLYDEYVYCSGETFIQILIGEETSNLSATGYAVSSLELTHSVTGNTITFVNPQVTYVGTISEDNKTITYVSSSGAASSYVENISFKAGHLLDNFESYTETGVGFDAKNTDITKVSGLRGSYYSDYYSGSSTNQSPVGGSGWSLMGSTDYVQLETSNGTGSSKALKHKVGSNTMRVMTGGLATGTATSQGVATKFCFSVRGISSQGFTLNVRSFHMSKVNPGNQQGATTKGSSYSIAQGETWTEIQADVLSSDFYGFGLTFKSGPSTAQYCLIDNVYILY